ncbi:hypothetical protein PG997_014420 [Apiospora hydei]|uniref:TLC domain-containing protein n=1 Tax=Apiospora hydei TaxID=1337664 RepID=A0ABR1UTS2_9PEZI
MASRELLSELLPATPLVLGVIGYTLATFWAEGLMRKRAPKLYSQLQGNHRALLYYTAMAVGKGLAVLFVPACALAAIQGNGTAAAVMGETPWQATTVEKVCVTSRIAIWVGEFPRTQLYPGLVAHHIWSITSAVLILAGGQPPQQLYVMYAALLTENFGKVGLKFQIIKKNGPDSPLKKLADKKETP